MYVSTDLRTPKSNFAGTPTQEQEGFGFELSTVNSNSMEIKHYQNIHFLINPDFQHFM